MHVIENNVFKLKINWNDIFYFLSEGPGTLLSMDA